LKSIVLVQANFLVGTDLTQNVLHGVAAVVFGEEEARSQGALIHFGRVAATICNSSGATTLLGFGSHPKINISYFFI
jgi:hypothetical protein